MDAREGRETNSCTRAAFVAVEGLNDGPANEPNDGGEVDAAQERFLTLRRASRRRSEAELVRGWPRVIRN